MRKPTHNWKTALALPMALMAALSFTPSVVHAEGQASDGIVEWAVDDGAGASEGFSAQAELPATFDLRNDGVVTPVKLQNPWGSCWAFGGMAAAETSILSSFGSTYDSSKLDLSERHLAYFALHPVTEGVDPTQVGEGLNTFDDSPNAAFDTGGLAIYITSLFSQGVGPVTESEFPYRGEGAHTDAQYYAEHPEAADAETRRQIEMVAKQQGVTYDQFLQSYAASIGVSVDEVFEMLRERVVTAANERPTYTNAEDWSIPETNAEGRSNRQISAGVVLENGNVLPSYYVGDALNLDSVQAIKQELMNGRGVVINYFADQSGQYTKTDDAGNRYNQYVPSPIPLNHTVCIVGWDDNYAADSFSNTAPGNGAWIVKNSWGSTTDAGPDDLGNVVNSAEYGIKDENGNYTGYFYLSYYDRSVTQPESMEFTADLGTEGKFYTAAYDYMPASLGFYTETPTTDVMSSANVFTFPDPVELRCVSTRTPEANQRVTFAIYELNENATNPTDGTLLMRLSRNFEYSGFHRLDLDQPIRVSAGKKISIVSTSSTIQQDGTRAYSISAARGLPADLAKQHNHKAYSVAVVNEGESWLYKDGQWQDWSAYLAEHDTGLEVDNFGIKAYGVPYEEVAPKVTTSYGGHAQDIGDLKEVTNGAPCGTTGQSKRLEAIWAKVDTGSIEYRSHVQNIGWEKEWVRDGGKSGTTGESKRVEAIQMKLSGVDGCQLWYRVHSQDFGWLGWACDGEPAGTANLSKRIEAYEVTVLPVGDVPADFVEGRPAFVGALAGSAHVQNDGWTPKAGSLSFGTTGMARRVEALSLELPAQPWDGGVSYSAHIQDKGWVDEVADGAVCGTTGQSKRIEAVKIHLTGEARDHLCVWYRVHSQDYGWLGWACDDAKAGTSGLAKRAEAVEIQVLPQGSFPDGYDESTPAMVVG